MKPIKKVALLHDLCGVGKAALTNMLPILSVMGVEACPIPTLLLSTHTGGYGVPVMQKISGEYIEACADHYKREQVHFDLIFIGYLGTVDIIKSIKYFLDCFPDTKIVFDPIMGDHGRFYKNFSSDYCRALSSLMSYADVVLPNATECCLMLNIPYKETFKKEELYEISIKLHKRFGSKNVIITGADGITLCEKENFTFLENKAIPGKYHGTGDAFDGVFVSKYVEGNPLADCIQSAHEFVLKCILESNKYDYNQREGILIEKNLYTLINFERK